MLAQDKYQAVTNEIEEILEVRKKVDETVMLINKTAAVSLFMLFLIMPLPPSFSKT